MTDPRTSETTSTTRYSGLVLAFTLLALIGTSCGPRSESTSPPPEGDIAVLVAIDGPGTVRVNGYDCERECWVQVDSGADVTFEAVPSSGNVLVAWGGVCDPLAPTCTRTFQHGDEVHATLARHALRIDMAGDGVGTIEIAGPTVNTTCGGDCGIAFSDSLNHRILIDASGRTELGAWSGSCENAEAPDYCYVVPTGATEVGMTWTHPPLAVDDAYTATRDAALVVDADDGVLANDDDTTNDELIAEVDDGPNHGTLDLASAGGFTYTPDSGYVGPDTFSYTVRDAFGSEDGADVTIEVINRAPVGGLDRYETDRSTPLTVAAPGVLANDSDPDGDALTAALITDVEHGSLTLRPNGGFDYDPAPGFAGNDRFTYQATDGDLTSAVTTVTIAVAATNRAPTAEADAYDLYRNDTFDIDAANGVLNNDDDPDGDTLQATLIDDVPTGEGDLELFADGSFTYDPESFIGTTQFTYQATDGELTSAVATVTITVINRPPDTEPDTYTTNHGELLSIPAPGVLGNDDDPDGDDLTATLLDNVRTGTLTFQTDGSFDYQPAGDDDGDDSFTYVANDGDLNSEPTTVSITVIAPDGDDGDDD